MEGAGQSLAQIVGGCPPQGANPGRVEGVAADIARTRVTMHAAAMDAGNLFERVASAVTLVASCVPTLYALASMPGRSSSAISDAIRLALATSSTYT